MLQMVVTAINDHLIAQGIDAYFVYHDAPLATLNNYFVSIGALERLKRSAPEHGVVASRP